MKKLALILFLGLSLASCHHMKDASKVNTEKSSGAEGSGTSFADAVIVDEKNESDGVAAEYAWLKVHYPGYSIIEQSLVFNEQKPYDLMKIKTEDGDKKTIYFDISSFYGKF